ncbi:MAG: hypothetical protein KDC92_13615 [Bacteroidetes bacterium]|nr:hypothetical protein [Bacteroidota bacterium]
MELKHALHNNRKVNTLFILASLVFVFHQIIESSFRNRIIDSYLDDLLCLPIALWLAQFILSLVLKKAFVLPVLYVVAGTALISLAAEFIFPLYNPYFVYDSFDFVAYAIGALLFHLLNNKKRL